MFTYKIKEHMLRGKLFELIHLNKNMKTKETKDQMHWFLKILFQYTQKNTASITCVLR